MYMITWIAAAALLFIVLAVYAPWLLVLIGILVFWIDRKASKHMSANPFSPHEPKDGPR